MINGKLVIDLFAGGGGASTGLEQAGIPVDYAVNHDPVAIAVHMANHPNTIHLCQDIWSVDPYDVVQGRPVGLLWASPDCTHHSRAKGGAPNRSVQRRELANVIVDEWVPKARPEVIMFENVPEFSEWGPLDNGLIIKDKKGEHFNDFIGKLRYQGYDVDYKNLMACDYGVPTSRTRLYGIARCDGLPIVWPKPTHGPGNIKYRGAAECIDFSLPCPSIFETAEDIKRKHGIIARRPLSDNTLRRIARGIKKYVIDNPNPYIVDGNIHTLVTMGYGEKPGEQPRVKDIEAPLPTITAGGKKAALVTAFISKFYGTNTGQKISAPLQTITASGQHHAVVAAYLQHVQHSSSPGGMSIDEPLRTITAMPKGGGIGMVQAFMVKYYGQGESISVDDPLDTITTKDRFGLVLVYINGEPYQIVDIGFRMLISHELYLCQGFPSVYEFLFAGGRFLTKTEQVRLVGDSVCPGMSYALAVPNIFQGVAV